MSGWDGRTSYASGLPGRAQARPSPAEAGVVPGWRQAASAKAAQGTVPADQGAMHGQLVRTPPLKQQPHTHAHTREGTHTSTHTAQMFKAAHCVATKWKRPKWLSTDEWASTAWPVHGGTGSAEGGLSTHQNMTQP